MPGVWGANVNYLSYQWQSNGVDIVGANGATYTTPMLTCLGDYTYGVKLILARPDSYHSGRYHRLQRCCAANGGQQFICGPECFENDGEL